MILCDKYKLINTSLPDCTFSQILQNNVFVVHASIQSIRLSHVTLSILLPLLYHKLVFPFIVIQNQRAVSDALQGVTAEHPKSDDPFVSVLQDASTQTDHSSDTLPSSTPNSATDQTIKAGPLPPICPYQCYGRSKKTEIRGEIVERFHDLLSLYVHGDAEALTYSMTYWSPRNGQAHSEVQE